MELSRTDLIERESLFKIFTESLFIILAERGLFLPNSNGGGEPSPSIASLRFGTRDPNTFLCSHTSNYSKNQNKSIFIQITLSAFICHI